MNRYIRFAFCIAVLGILTFADGQKDDQDKQEMDKIRRVSCSTDAKIKEKVKKCEEFLPDKIKNIGKSMKETVAKSMSEDDFKKAMCAPNNPIHAKIKKHMDSGNFKKPPALSAEEETQTSKYFNCLMAI